MFLHFDAIASNGDAEPGLLARVAAIDGPLLMVLWRGGD